MKSQQQEKTILVVTRGSNGAPGQVVGPRAKANKNPLLSIFGPQVEWGNCSKSNISAHNRRQRPRLHQVVQRLRKLDLIPWLPSLSTSILLVRRKWWILWRVSNPVVIWNPQAVRPKEEFLKSQKFKASLWLCEDYPLSLQEQVQLPNNFCPPFILCPRWCQL